MSSAFSERLSYEGLELLLYQRRQEQEWLNWATKATKEWQKWNSACIQRSGGHAQTKKLKHSLEHAMGVKLWEAKPSWTSSHDWIASRTLAKHCNWFYGSTALWGLCFSSDWRFKLANVHSGSWLRVGMLRKAWNSPFKAINVYCLIWWASVFP